jgi:hypothetical protein
MRDHVRHCPCCGGPIIADDRFGLTPTQRRIVAVLKRRGTATAEELRDALWGDDSGGGPDALSTLHAHVWHLNQRLRPHGLRVRASRWSGYRITATDA